MNPTDLLRLPPPFRLAGLIAAHQDGVVDGRLRLQKTVYLLQQAGFDLGYRFRMYHYGPYSEGLHGDTRTLGHRGLVNEHEEEAWAGTRFCLTATDQAGEFAPIVHELGAADALKRLEAADPRDLELAATYRYYRDLGYEQDEALTALRGKKRDKATDGAVTQALALLDDLRVPR
jgi:uncharacterized protein YwgA